LWYIYFVGLLVSILPIEIEAGRELIQGGRQERRDRWKEGREER
jgi:hypothetical protein